MTKFVLGNTGEIGKKIKLRRLKKVVCFNRLNSRAQFSSKEFSRIIFPILFKVFNHQIVSKKN